MSTASCSDGLLALLVILELVGVGEMRVKSRRAAALVRVLSWLAALRVLEYRSLMESRMAWAGVGLMGIALAAWCWGESAGAVRRWLPAVVWTGAGIASGRWLAVVVVVVIMVVGAWLEEESRGRVALRG